MKGLVDKQATLEEVVREHLHDGASFAFGGLGAREPTAVAHEIIRQKKKNLNMIMASGMDAANILIGAGCVSKVETGYLWIGIVGTGLNFRRAVEQGVPCKLEVEEYTNATASQRFLAGAMGLPFLPTLSLLGSDIPKYNDKIKIINDPYTDKPIALVPAANPDVAFIHVQKADIYGNSQIWGLSLNDHNIARAAKKTIITCEEIISTEEIRKLPNMTAVPYYCVDAVVHVPYCSHPFWTAGYYWCDIPFRRNFMLANKTQEGLESWIQEWIINTGSWEKYLDKLGQDRLDKLMEMERDNYKIPVLDYD